MGAAATTSRGILQMSKSNKTGLSFRLDSTLCAGHDMQTFGLGTAASLASVERYARFTSSMLHVYGAMECALDASTSPAVNSVWKLYADSLRREAALRADLADVAETLSSVHRASEATRAYVAAIQIAAAADEADKGGRLIGHLYCRYFADLFGGQALAAPTRWALGPAVKPGTPRHYDFGEFGAHRQESIEALYWAFNEAGILLGCEQAQQAVVDETLRAFSLNVAVYTEDGALWSDAARGVSNMLRGWVRERLELS